SLMRASQFVLSFFILCCCCAHRSLITYPTRRSSDLMDNKYKSNFLYESTNAFVEGFYLTQKLIVGLVTLWPLLLVGALIIYLLRRRKINLHVKPQLSDK